MVWSRVIFWCLFVLWILDILQPGYLKFYDARSVFIKVVAVVMKSSVVKSPKTNTYKPTPTQTSTNNNDGYVNAACAAPTNDFERLARIQGIGCEERTR
ncbi:hypothetical protein CAL7716_065220 [Calothrix sp. PCC 7716]|nr:hypothetical protein CAL7716_065220 [Calothrix sp. PCC 7716]